VKKVLCSPFVPGRVTRLVVFDVLWLVLKVVVVELLVLKVVVVLLEVDVARRVLNVVVVLRVVL
jgi:hypothetical protein